MGLDRAMNISLSGVKAERLAMELIASNLANINTTRSMYGGPYRRKIAVLGEQPLSFGDELAKAEAKYSTDISGGVEVVDVVEDMSPLPRVYNPGHPDADEQGYVLLPNVKQSEEMVNQIYTSKLYEANITAYNAIKKMQQDTINAF